MFIEVENWKNGTKEVKGINKLGVHVSLGIMIMSTAEYLPYQLTSSAIVDQRTHIHMTLGKLVSETKL